MNISKEKFQIVIFAAFVVLVASLLRYFSGPFYFGNNSDPSYFYLYNFIYILEGKSPQFVDHPGTPLDMLGALVIKIFFPPQQNTPFLSTYIPQAEHVLGIVWFSMIIIYAMTFVILGFYALKKSQDRIFTGLVLLSSLWLIIIRSFVGQGILPISANVNSDTMMMTADNLMLLAMLRFYFSNKPQAFSQAVCLAAAVAFAIATKFTAIPFFVVAFVILVTWQQRVLLVVLVIGFFILLTFPIWGAYPHMIFWVKGLILNRGMHGHGEQGFDIGTYLQNFAWVIKNHWFFVAGWLLAGIVAITGRTSVDFKIRRILMGLLLGGLTQIIIVAKQPSFQYMAPMIGVTSLVLAFTYKAFPDWWHRGLKQVVIVILAVSVAFIGFSMWHINDKTKKTRAMLDIIKNEYSQSWVCPFYRSSTPGFGFVFWNNVLHRDDYSVILKSYYPDFVYFDIFSNDFKDSAEQIVPLAALRQERNRVLLYGSDVDPKNFEPYLTVNKIYTNGGSEALYEVISARSNQGVEYFKLAMLLYNHGQFEDALKAAMISQQLGVGQDLTAFIAFLRQKIQTPLP